MSSSTTHPATGPRQTPSSGRGGRRSQFAVVATVLMIAAVLAPCTASLIPQEIGRWKLAAALRLRSKGQREAAYEQLDAAIERFPKNPQLLLQRAEWRMEDGKREEALADADQMVEVSGDHYQWLMVHSQFVQNAGEFERAVDDWKKIEQFSRRSGIPRREVALNGLAYAEALAKVNLEAALDHVNEALKLEPDSASILDTRGYILHLQGENEEALADLDRAVKGVDEELQQKQAKSGGGGTPIPVNDTIASSRPKTLRELLESPANSARAAAVIHYHRALALEAVQRDQEAAAERAIVRNLIGKEGDETLF